MLACAHFLVLPSWILILKLLCPGHVSTLESFYSLPIWRRLFELLLSIDHLLLLPSLVYFVQVRRIVVVLIRMLEVLNSLGSVIRPHHERSLPNRMVECSPTGLVP